MYTVGGTRIKGSVTGQRGGILYGLAIFEEVSQLSEVLLMLSEVARDRNYRLCLSLVTGPLRTREMPAKRGRRGLGAAGNSMWGHGEQCRCLS